jgi:hypothetical protein
MTRSPAAFRSAACLFSAKLRSFPGRPQRDEMRCSNVPADYRKREVLSRREQDGDMLSIKAGGPHSHPVKLQRRRLNGGPVPARACLACRICHKRE